MRRAFAAWLIMVAICSVQAQEQERKLLDRILKPDMTLQNSEQNKKFTADRSSVHRPTHVSTFYLQQKRETKHFSDTRNAASWQFNAQSFNQRQQASANYLSQKSAANSKRNFSASNVSGLQSSRDVNKTKSGRDYLGKRPFLDQGKSQKSLNRKNEPLTIEQVRELLNKNK